MSPLALLLVRDVVRLVRTRAPAVAEVVAEARSVDSEGGRRLTKSERWALVLAVLGGVSDLAEGEQ